MRHVLFVQGGGENVHDEWDDKLVASLTRELGDGYEIRYPRMPNEADPSYASWKPAVERELAALASGAVVVGHSVGGTILLHTLAEWTPPVQLGAICLIAAPFVGEGGWPSDELTSRPDIAERLPSGVPILLYHGEDDTEVPVAHLSLYARAIPHARVRRLGHRDHQLTNSLAEVARDIRSLGDARAP